MTQSIATKFPEVDINEMDNLVNSGEFISRSDLIREGARKIIEKQKMENKEIDKYVLDMERKGTFKDPELRVLAELYIGNELSENWRKIAKRLTRHPFDVVKFADGKFILTENGNDVAEGLIDALLHLRTIKNVK